MKTTTITLDKEYEVKELTLGQFPKLFKKVKGIYDKIGQDVKDMEKESFINAIVQLSEKGWDDFMDLLVFATGIERETLENEAGISGSIAIFDAVWEVNDIELLKKRLAPLFQTPPQESSQNSPKSTDGVQAQSSTKSPKAKPSNTSK